MTQEMLRCEARDAGRSQTTQRGAGDPLGMRPRSGMRAPVARSVRRPALPDHPGGGPSGRGSGRLYDAKEGNDADGHFLCKPARGAAFRRSALSRALRRGSTIRCGAFRASHSGKPAPRPRGVFQQPASTGSSTRCCRSEFRGPQPVCHIAVGFSRLTHSSRGRGTPTASPCSAGVCTYFT